MTAVEDVVVVGAGPAGLGVAAELEQAGCAPLVLTASARPGDTWRAHYDRLHLHTTRALSHLPGQTLPARHGRWVAKDDLAGYLDRYAVDRLSRLRVGAVVDRISPHGDGWVLDLPDGRVTSRAVVVATGVNRLPRPLDLPGRSAFRGEVVHSSQYRSASRFGGRRVLVVGAGNSGAEIAADLVGHAAAVTVAVRTPPTIVPRSVAGVPLQVLGVAVQALPTALADLLVRALSRLTTGDLTRYGMPRATAGAISRARRDNVTLTIDVGLVEALRTGRLRVTGPAQRFTPGGVEVGGGTVVPVDVVIAATGYRTGLEDLLDVDPALLDDKGWPVRPDPLPGLFLHGFANEPGGNLRHFRRRARPTADAVLRHLATAPARSVDA